MGGEKGCAAEAPAAQGKPERPARIPSSTPCFIHSSEEGVHRWYEIIDERDCVWHHPESRVMLYMDRNYRRRSSDCRASIKK
jgi:hypothetical protein